MKPFVRNALTLFLSLRIADAVNLAVGLWFVPKYVSPADLGALLPASTLATTLAVPVFAFSMVFMREGALLARNAEFGRWKSLVTGVFAGIPVLLAIAVLLGFRIVPGYLRRLDVSDTALGSLILAGAVLGSVAPVYTHGLNALKRFRSLGLVEILSASVRLLVLTAVMPFRALFGYFLGSLCQPLARILLSVLSLRRELAVKAEPYWTRGTALRLARDAVLVTAYMAGPLLASLAEQTFLRIRLGASDSAGYYVATRLSDLINYLTLPLLFVLFPHAAQSGDDPSSVRRMVRSCQAATVAVSLALAFVYALWGEVILPLVPTGADYLGFASYLPWLVGIAALNACQVFATNASVAAGRLGFLAWHLPLNLGYAALMTVAPGIVSDLPALLCLMTAEAVLRFVFGQTTMSQPR